jgi:tRNA threonylcarbamoyladenosine biosynthesis protein TsaE
MQFICKNLSDLEIIAQNIISLYEKTPNFPNVWILEGEMGAGKTTFAKILCKAFGITDHVQSPTYSLVNEYFLGNLDKKDKKNNKIYHFDFYRIKNEEEAWNIGTEEYFDSQNICLVEWASQIPSLLPKNILKIEIKIDENPENTRIFTITNIFS